MANVFKSGKMASNQLDVSLANGIAAVAVPDGALVICIMACITIADQIS